MASKVTPGSPDCLRAPPEHRRSRECFRRITLSVPAATVWSRLYNAELCRIRDFRQSPDGSLDSSRHGPRDLAGSVAGPASLRIPPRVFFENLSSRPFDRAARVTADPLCAPITEAAGRSFRGLSYALPARVTFLCRLVRSIGLLPWCARHSWPIFSAAVESLRTEGRRAGGADEILGPLDSACTAPPHKRYVEAGR
jgi:hypothetical protein